MSAPPLAGDMKAGFIGLAVAVVLLLVWVVAIVLITDRLTGHHDAPAAAAVTQQR
jgi:hypothetical protein